MTRLERLRDTLANGIGELPGDLPVYGGEDPIDTTEVWSWDEDSLLVGTFRGDLRIVPRRDWGA